ncbi:MAG: hypothetical protein ACOCUS_00775 [Polyangiales bacterium]
MSEYEPLLQELAGQGPWAILLYFMLRRLLRRELEQIRSQLGLTPKRTRKGDSDAPDDPRINGRDRDRDDTGRVRRQ